MNRVNLSKRDIALRWARTSAFVFAFCIPIVSVISSQLRASDLDDVRTFYRTGDYAACIELSKAQVEKGVWNDVWYRMLIEASMATGDYSGALEAYEKAIGRFSDSIRLRLIGVRVYRMNNLPNKAKEQIAFMDALFDRAPSRFTNRADLVPLGEYFLIQGEDPKQVLKICYDQAIKSDPKSTEAHVATARMALDKNDDKVASQALAKAAKLDDKDPEIYYLMARAWSSTEPAKSNEYLLQSLAINPRFAPSLLMQAESRLSAEDYIGAVAILAELEQTNERLPKMWALRAAIAHLQGVYADEGEFRRKALLPWSLNPEVDFTIGQQLSTHYRFAESVEYQRRALKMDAEFTPAKSQLAQDLLRLGELDAGWDLVNSVRTKDPYDVAIFNLKQLQSQLEKLETLEAPGFVIRMDAREARIYGREVVELLSEARTVLTEKYSVELAEPIYVEIFPRQKEFAIRTFGLPGGEGFLGVCFGRLITANSPAALSVDSNWKSVLWHEYCHVVTLQKTKNKMPRWLSEGISVYEERQRNPSWGQSINSVYREMILGDDFVPMSRLSSAFMRPKTPMHLQFAYYEASLAVEFWIKTYGMKTLLKLLDDLAVGMPPDDALRRIPGSLDALDEEFYLFATASANAYGQGLDFAKPSAEGKSEMQAWLTEHPKSLVGLRTVCQSLMASKNWDEALLVANELQRMLPEDGAHDGVYAMLAAIHRAQSRPELERAALVNLAERSADCRQALMRLIELDQKKEDWKSVVTWCQRMTEIDPLRFDVQNALASASEQIDAPEIAVRGLSACLEMEPTDPAGVHFRLAVALEKTGELERAKRHVLLALEESPRYTEALTLLAKISKQSRTRGDAP